MTSKDLTFGISRRRLIGGSLSLGLAGAIAPALLGGARGALAQEPKAGGTLRIAFTPVAGLDPIQMESAGDIAAVQQVAEYLVWAEPDLTLRPVLATDWRSTDGGTTWVFDIRQGVKFHDGQELTADDVVATFQRLVDPEVASAGAAQLSFLKKEGVSKLGTHQVQFVLDQPVGEFPFYLTNYNAVILSKDYADDFASKPNGTGPFKLTSYRPQEGLSFVRNPDYWDTGKPYLDAVEIQTFEEPQGMILALQGGQIDALLSSTYIDALPLLGSADIHVDTESATSHRQLCMRVDQAPFDDMRVRQAVAWCLKRPELVQGLIGGLGDIGNDHAVAPVYPEKVALEQRAQDIEKAKQLLAEAGHPDGFDIDLYTGRFLELPQYAQLIQQMLAPAGIRVNLVIEPINDYYNHWTEVTFGLTDWASRPTAIQILGTAFRGGAEWNAAKWKNDAFDGLLDQIAAEVDLAKRTALLQRAAEIMNEEVPAVIAYFISVLRPMRKNVLGLEANISDYLDLTRTSLA